MEKYFNLSLLSCFHLRLKLTNSRKMTCIPILKLLFLSTILRGLLSLRFHVILGLGLPFAEHVKPTGFPSFVSNLRCFKFDVKFHGGR